MLSAFSKEKLEEHADSERFGLAKELFGSKYLLMTLVCMVLG